MRLFLLEPSLVGYSDHYYEGTKALAYLARKRGVPCWVLANMSVSKAVIDELRAIPTFSDPTNRYYLHSRLAVFTVEPLVANWKFFRVLCKAAEEHAWGRDDIVYANFADHRQLLAWFTFIFFRRKRRCPRVMLTMRESYYLPTCRRWSRKVLWLRPLLLLLGCLPKHKKVSMSTDGELLRQEYARITRVPFIILPIPQIGSRKGTSEAVPQNEALTFVSLGAARKEKGIDVLAEALTHLEDLLLEGSVKFILQVNILYDEPETAAAVFRLKQKQGASVMLIENELTAEEYQGLLASSDVVLLPYRQENYYARSSCVLAEAIASGKVAIVTDRTWLAAEVRAHGSGITFADGDSRSLALAIRDCLTRKAELQQEAAGKAKAYQEWHSPERFWQTLMADATG